MIFINDIAAFSIGLSKMKLNVYEQTIKCLQNFIKMITLEVGIKRSWKLSQSDSILATSSILDLQDIFLNEKEFHFLLTSRFT